MTNIIGTHIIVNVFDIKDNSILKYLDTGKIISDEIVKSLHLHVVGTSSHQFEPEGYTLLYLLSESHYSIHTYPEFHSCYIDIFCCNKDFKADYALEVIKQHFDTKNVQHYVIKR